MKYAAICWCMGSLMGEFWPLRYEGKYLVNIRASCEPNLLLFGIYVVYRGVTEVGVP